MLKGDGRLKSYKEKLSETASGPEIPTIKLSTYPIDEKVAAMIPLPTAGRLRCLPLEVRGSRLTLAMVEPEDYRAVESVRFITGMEVEPVRVAEEELEAVLRGLAGSVSEADTYLWNQWSKMGSESRQKEAQAVLGSDLAAEKLLNELLEQGAMAAASDLHLEPGEADFTVRMRVDGRLRRLKVISRASGEQLVVRIKVLANLDIAEKRLPQDGRLRLKVGSEDMGLRVSTLPTIYGEKVVIRMLNKSMYSFRIEDLGLLGDNQQRFQKLLELSSGLIVVCGPTGSGKTSTLYAMLDRLNRPEVNIVTLEDPVERAVAGTNQVEINHRAGMTFGKGLRSVLRQDPDIIMVGEIRDKETAKLAVHAALTGHLVLTTLHTNDSLGVILRLLDLEVEPLLLSEALAGIVCQRLVPSLCCHCREPYFLSKNRAEAVGLPHLSGSTFYRSRGCSLCGQRGLAGRTALQEVVLTSPALRGAIAKGGKRGELELILREEPVSIWEDGIKKAGKGWVALEEVVKTLKAEVENFPWDRQARGQENERRSRLPLSSG